ncbi:hypothetical protein Bbelb_445570 [Branchiostoma belcheri]|nr:hypothetical protein Bbelb_445570 [Branchiostoma belcheri]
MPLAKTTVHGDSVAGQHWTISAIAVRIVPYSLQKTSPPPGAAGTAEGPAGCHHHGRPCQGSVSQGEGVLSNAIAFDAVRIRDGVSQRYSLVAKLTDFKGAQTVLKRWSNDNQIKVDTAEVKFYSDVVPELLSLATPSTERKTGNEETHHPANSLAIPKCYFAATYPSTVVSVRVMENLKAQGFSIKTNRQSLSRDEMMLAAGALAQLHGLSHRLELRSGIPLPEKYDWIGTLSDVKAAWRDADLISRLEKLGTLSPMMEEDPRLAPKVYSHADCWINNIMFKYDKDVPTDVRLVDWQTPRYLPATFDLTFLFLCNAGWDVFHDHRDAILAHYHHKQMSTLGTNEPSGLQSYTLEQLKADFKADCLYGVIDCSCISRSFLQIKICCGFFRRSRSGELSE